MLINRGVAKNNGKLNKQLEELIFSLTVDPAFVKVYDPAESNWSVGQQIDHIAKSTLRIVGEIIPECLGDIAKGETVAESSGQGVIASQIECQGGGLTWVGRMVLTTGFIKRGVGKAPAGVVPELLPADGILLALEQAKASIDSFESWDIVAESAGRVKHPTLGCLTAKQWLWFCVLHNHHHIKIVRDIDERDR